MSSESKCQSIRVTLKNKYGLSVPIAEIRSEYSRVIGDSEPNSELIETVKSNLISQQTALTKTDKSMEITQPAQDTKKPSGGLTKTESAIMTTGKGLGLTLSTENVKQISQTLPTEKPTKLQITQKILSFLDYQKQADSESLKLCEDQVKQKLTEYFEAEDENTEKLMSTVTDCYREGNDLIRKKNQSILDILDDKIATVKEQISEVKTKRQNLGTKL